MKNKLFWGLLVGVVIVMAVIVWAAASSLSQYGISDPIAAVCTIAFLLVAFVAWEILMKPGYGLLGRSRGREEDEEPPSPPAA